jgi:hypothetical protein
MTNTLAYYVTEFITSVNVFMIYALGSNVIKPFGTIIYKKTECLSL